jgi:hypothetical protein
MLPALTSENYLLLVYKDKDSDDFSVLLPGQKKKFRFIVD